MKKLKLMTIIGTRPEIIKLSEIIKKADLLFDHILVHTGQNYDYELNQVFFNELGIREPDFYLDVVGGNLGQTLGNILDKSYSIISEVMPDALLVLGDTNSCLSVISAKRLKVPIFHIEAGNRCFDENLPEEINRRIIDHTSDINMAYTEHARRYLNNEGIKNEYTFVIGSPMREVIDANIGKIIRSTVLKTLKLEKRKYILLSVHREENIDIEDNFIQLFNSLNDIAKHYDLPIVYSVHPRSNKAIKKRKINLDKRIIQMPPFGFSDYINLQQNALVVISDSGTLAEESAILKFPSVSVRTSTERPEGIDNGSLLIGSITSQQLIQAIELAISLSNIGYTKSDVKYYNDSNVSIKVINIIQSYTSIVNKNIWKKR